MTENTVVERAKPRKQTSSTISSLAGKYARMTNAKLWRLVYRLGDIEDREEGEAEQFFRDIRKMAASCLSQDEQKGQSAKHRSGK